jgi:hypothetical protein
MAKLGIQNNGVFIGAMSFPDRKKPCFGVERGNEFIVLGHFIDAKRVDEFESALRDLLGEKKDV